MAATYFRKLQINRDVRDHILAFASAITKEPAEDVTKLIEAGINLINGSTHFYTQESRTVFFTQGYHFMELLSDEQVKELRVHATHWYICEYQSSNNDKVVSEGLSGQKAWTEVMKEIKKHYTKDEVEFIKKTYSWTPATEDVLPPSPKHMTPYSYCFNGTHFEEILEFDNCVYYDLNKAYAHALMTMFPEIDTWVRKGYERDKPTFKKVMNYTVGMMTRHESWKRVRDQIVLDVSKRIEDVEFHCDGDTVYVNTDGIIISNPKHTIKTSNEIGDFKKEQVDNGKIWTYRHAGNPRLKEPGYAILQYFENGKKVIKSLGGFRCEPELMEGIDLSKGIVASYRIKDVKGLQLVDKESIRIMTIEEAQLRKLEGGLNYGR